MPSVSPTKKTMAIEEPTERLIASYLLAAAEWWEAETDRNRSGGRAAVKRGNRAADEMRRLATEIGLAGPSSILAFSRLFAEPRNGIQSWAAFHALEVMPSPSEVVDQAFTVLEDLAEGGGMQAFGIRMRLNELRTLFSRSGPKPAAG